MSKATRHIGRGARAWTAVLAVAVLGLALFAAAAQAVPATFWGVVPQATPSQEQFQRLQRGGVDSIRIPIDWGAVQPTPGRRLRLVGHRRRGRKGAPTPGIEVLPFLTGAPAWAVPSVWVPGSGHTVKAPGHLPASRRRRAPPGRASSSGAVARYGPDGASGPRTRPSPKRPIRTWQIWNEPNFKYFVAKPNPAEYGKLVKLSYAALKGADPGAKVVLGGMFSRPKGARIDDGKSRSASTSPATSSTRCTRRRRGSRRSSTASPCTPTPATTRN